MRHTSTWKSSLIVLALSLFILSLSACGHNVEEGHDTYYSSNVKPQFTPSYPEQDNLDNNMSMNETTDNEAMNGQSLDNNNDSMNDNGTMMNGQVMNDQQKRLMDEVLSVTGVNDATIIVNDNNIVVGIDVENIAQRAEVVNQVKNLLQRKHEGYQVSVTAERAMHDRIRLLQDEQALPDKQPVVNFMDDLKSLLEDIGKTVTEPLR